MAVSPLHPAAPLPVAPVAAAVPNAPADAALAITSSAVAATAGATDSNSTRDPSSDPSQQPQTIEKALEDINEQMKAWSTQLQFEVDPDINRVVVSVVDSKSGDVVRTIPSEAVLRIAKMIVKLQGNAVETSA
ncbi:flagellar protein [Bordetella ansorpii]|uniref:Flagellar protein n=1 Tax=Bordetella ansorpii TaxID=288768 RepID=A0A157M1E1_9BORD|nr:flagellar protein FlaG [Bordetella ansorpii]SAI02650.1 flagellar protein [Bordetella ansorpii]